MAKTNQDMYGLDTEKTNAFYVVHRKIEIQNENDFVLCGGVIGREYLDQNDYDFKHSNLLQKISKYSPKEAIYLIIGYLVLVILSINRLIKFNKKNTADYNVLAKDGMKLYVELFVIVSRKNFFLFS